jgi:predicted ATPase
VPLAAALRNANLCSRDQVERLPALAAIFPEVAVADEKREYDEVDVLEALVALIDDQAPIVLCLDDLHWADAQTVAAIGYLRRRGEGRRAALVLTACPTEVSSEHPLRSLLTDALVRLEPLTAEELQPLGIPELYASTGGHPALIAEVMRCGGSAPSRTLIDALLAQCRAEGKWGCRILTTASLLEQPFAPQPLAELLDADAGELSEELERLCERRILRVEGVRFRFRYELVRQALLESISPARQQLLRQRLEQVATPTNGASSVRLVATTKAAGR